MLAALTPSSVVNTSTTTTNTIPIQQSTCLTISNNNSVNTRTTNSPVNLRSNGSSFGWGNRERKMEENWRMQNRNI
jgi:hypothetical protein